MSEGWLKDPDAIYRLSFERARSATDLSRVPVALHDVALRLVHACARPDIVGDIVASADAMDAGVAALTRGAPILADSRMTAAGITRAFLPPAVEVSCILDGADVEGRAKSGGTTRSAAGIDAVANWLGGSLVAIGNAPTALFRLLEIAAEPRARPALILGFPVGFVGAAESKEMLINSGLPYIALRGAFGGSALAAAAVNAVALAARRSPK